MVIRVRNQEVPLPGLDNQAFIPVDQGPHQLLLKLGCIHVGIRFIIPAVILVTPDLLPLIKCPDFAGGQ